MNYGVCIPAVFVFLHILSFSFFVFFACFPIFLFFLFPYLVVDVFEKEESCIALGRWVFCFLGRFYFLVTIFLSYSSRFCGYFKEAAFSKKIVNLIFLPDSPKFSHFPFFSLFAGHFSGGGCVLAVFGILRI